MTSPTWVKVCITLLVLALDSPKLWRLKAQTRKCEAETRPRPAKKKKMSRETEDMVQEKESRKQLLNQLKV